MLNVNLRGVILMQKKSGTKVLLLLIALGALLIFYLNMNNDEPFGQNSQTDNTITASEVFQDALENNQPVWLMFRTENCPYCVELKKSFDELKQQYDGEIVFIDVNLDERVNYDLGKEYQIRFVPVTYIYDKNGEISFEKGGLIEKEVLIDELDKVAQE